MYYFIGKISEEKKGRKLEIFCNKSSFSKYMFFIKKEHNRVLNTFMRVSFILSQIHIHIFQQKNVNVDVLPIYIICCFLHENKIKIYSFYRSLLMSKVGLFSHSE